MSPVFVTAPFLVQKALKTATPKSSFFRVRRQMWCLSLQIRSFSVEIAVLWIPFEKQANSIPPSLSPFVTASSPLAFGPKKCAKAAQSPSSGGLRSSQNFPRHASQPRTSLGTRQPAEVSACDTSARRTCHRLCHRSVWLRFWCKKRSKRPTPKSSFFRVRRQVGCLSLKFRSFSVESRLQTLTLRIPHELVTAKATAEPASLRTTWQETPRPAPWQATVRARLPSRNVCAARSTALRRQRGS